MIQKYANIFSCTSFCLIDHQTICDVANDAPQPCISRTDFSFLTYFKILCLLINESKLPLFAVNLQVLQQDILTSDSGELTEVGRSYVPPRVLLDALCIICSAASQWGDPVEAESLAMETLIVAHHPSIGKRKTKD